MHPAYCASRIGSMNDNEFIAVLSWYAAASNWGWDKLERDTIETINAMIDRESTNRGFKSWAHALHALAAPASIV